MRINITIDDDLLYPPGGSTSVSRQLSKALRRLANQIWQQDRHSLSDRYDIDGITATVVDRCYACGVYEGESHDKYCDRCWD